LTANSQINAIAAHPAFVCEAHDVSDEPSIAATMMWQMNIPAAPMIKDVFRLKLSRNSTAGNVNTI
jgi:hypothetical protein